MSTSIILLDQNSSANDVDIMVNEPCMVLPPFSHGSNEPHGPNQLKSSRKVDILMR